MLRCPPLGIANKRPMAGTRIRMVCHQVMSACCSWDSVAKLKLAIFDSFYVYRHQIIYLAFNDFPECVVVYPFW
jgi:hypothetical protein